MPGPSERRYSVAFRRRAAPAAIEQEERGAVNEGVGRRHLVVGTVDPHPVTWDLPRAQLHRRTDIPGGIRTMHELAFALAATGREVELRGEVSQPIYDALAAATGVRPELPADERPPGGDDLVVIPEGGEDPLRFGRYVLSPARLVVALLAPPGQFGWPFCSPWSPAEHLSVDPAGLALPEHFRAMAALGVDLWTHMPRIQQLARAAGARCEFIGNGDPFPAAPPSAKDLPVIYVESNRWRELAEQVAGMMEAPVVAVAATDHDSLLATLARARVLLLPARIEGDGRLLREARSVGTVAVGLSSQVYATGLEEAYGAIAVDSLPELAATADALLGESERLERLSEAGRRSALDQVDWARYVQRVGGALARAEEGEPDVAASARAEFGRGLRALLAQGSEAIARVAELDAQLADANSRVAVLDRELASARELMSAGGAQGERPAPRSWAVSLGSRRRGRPGRAR